MKEKRLEQRGYQIKSDFFSPLLIQTLEQTKPAHLMRKTPLLRMNLTLNLGLPIFFFFEDDIDFFFLEQTL